MRSILKLLGGAAALLALSLGTASANEPAIEIIGGPTSITVLPTGQARDQLQPLMAPIQQRLVQGDAQSTTSIAQLGSGNFASAFVEGDRNLAVIAQGGSGNRAVQAIQGHSSAMLLVQGGTNNRVLQASVGNDNFQAVGVSGSNNNVGLVQLGDGLAAGLNLAGAQNANVFMLQTEQSRRYLMPSGLTGLQNTTVVVVPGRMYVFPHRR